MARQRKKSDEDRVVRGYWNSEEVLAGNALPKMPSYDPTGGLLFPLDGRETEALVLHMFDGTWRPLSTSAVQSYAATDTLHAGRPVCLVTYDASGKAAAWKATRLLSPISPDQIEAEYGKEAHRRARHDRPALRVELARKAVRRAA